ncbi:MAG: mechanosensitive ion channel family protein [Alphaproteobacteria bacterium]|nr:mechanosensitive ion channel family protein [Alphaproteobacteria bacterium]
MDKHSRNVLIICIISLILLLFGYHYSEYISPQDTGTLFDYERFVKAGIVFLISLTISRLLFVVIIRRKEAETQIRISEMTKYLIGIVVFTLGALFIVTQVYNESAGTILVCLGASSLGLIYVCQDMVKDLFAGFAIAFQDDFRVGDWVKFPDGTIAKIIKLKLTGVDLWLLNGTQLYVSNHLFSEQPMINLNQPDRHFGDGITVTIEHKVPVESARRILEAAVLRAPTIATPNILVAAESIAFNGVVFAIFYDVPDYHMMRRVRHQVISSVISHLRRHNIKVCEIAAQYNVSNIDPKTIIPIQEECVTTSLNSLQMCGLLNGCSREVQIEFSSKMKRKSFKAGSTVCNEGDDGNSMFIIAEGVVDVYKKMNIEKDGQNIEHLENVEMLVDGEYFGEMSILRNEPRAATIIAKTDLVLFEVERETIKEFAIKYNDFAEKLSIAMTERDIDNITTKEDVTTEMLQNKTDKIAELLNAFKSFLGR